MKRFIGAALVAVMASVGPAVATAQETKEFTLTGELTKAEENEIFVLIYAVAIKPAGEAQQEYQLNGRFATIEGEIEQMVGKTVEANVRVTPGITVVNLKHAGVMMIPENEGGLQPGDTTLVISGTLSGAAVASAPGDYPEVLTVTAEDGKAMTFEMFVKPELTKLDGKTVELFYEDNTSREVLSIKVVE